MEGNKTLTIITPVYNCEKFIEETIESVLLHSRNYNCEYIVVNDGSSDKTLALIEKYSSLVTIIDQANSGESQAINNGLLMAQGRFCLIVSADDPLPSSDLFFFSLDILNSNEDIVVTYPDWSIIDDKGYVISKVTTEDYSEQALIGRFKCIPGPGAIFRTDLARKVGGRDPLYKFVGDYDFWLKLSRYGKFQRIPHYLAQWRYHENSTSIKLRGFAMASERISVIDNFIQNNDIKPSRLTKSAIACSYYHAAILAYFSSEIPGRKWLIHSFRIYRGWIPGAKLRAVVYLLLFPASYRLVQLLNTTAIGRFLPKG